MLSVDQTRTVQWERDVAEFRDTEMIAIGNAILKAPHFWMDLEAGPVRSERINHDDRALLVLYICLTAEDDIVLEIMHIQ